VLVDNDVVEPRNRTGLLGTQVRPHEQKVAAVGRILPERSAGISVQEVAWAGAQRPVVEVLMDQPTVIITAADSEAVRFVGACYAAALGLAHLDVGIGVHEQDGRPVRGGQVVFVPPGQGCLLCVRDLRWLKVERDLVGDAAVQLEARQTGQRRDDTLGTVPDLLSRVASTGIGLLRRWLAEGENKPQRLFLHDDGLVEQLPRARPQQQCPICTLARGQPPAASRQRLYPARGISVLRKPRVTYLIPSWPARRSQPSSESCSIWEYWSKRPAGEWGYRSTSSWP